MLLTKGQILGAEDLTTEDVDVPEWGGTVRVRTMTGTDRDQYEQTLIRDRGNSKEANIANVRALLLAYTIVTADNELMFSAGDIVALGKKSIRALNRVFNVATNLNALSTEDVEELAGNSEAAQSGDSTTDLPDSMGEPSESI